MKEFDISLENKLNDQIDEMLSKIVNEHQLVSAFLHGYSAIIYLMSLANRRDDRPSDEDIQFGCDLVNLYGVKSYEAIRDYASEEEAGYFVESANKLLRQCIKGGDDDEEVNHEDN